MAHCPRCGDGVESIGVSGGGRVGWFCWSCEAIYPDGSYISMRDRPVDD